LTISFRQQRSIARAVGVEGFGYWSGRDVRIEFRPAPPDCGVVFVRSDLSPPRRIAARVDNRIEVPRRTSLCEGGARVDMVEHILAALAGLNIDNCEVWADSAEMPGCDGSGLPFVIVLDAAGVVDQAAARHHLPVPRVVRVGDDRCWVEARPSEANGLSVECHIDYGPRGPIGRQSFRIGITPETFRRELAAARTFILEEEAEWLRSQGLGARVTCQDLLVFNDQGPLDNPLRFPDECVRHKTLDLVGDLALAGSDLVGHFVAHCSGHRLNAELVRALLAEVGVASGLQRSA
jgi:UDP-3-O-acyl N-acetylglucosamine deacetylase